MIQTIDYLLKDISTNGSVYDQFTPESYLAAEQLNKLTDYFEDSDRLRTTKLHGVGIVCGFQYSVNKAANGRLETIDVTPGVAITTDGDLLHTDLKTLSSYLPFSNKAVYGRLNANGGKIVELRERLAAGSPKAETLPGELPLASLTNYNDYKLVVYLEHYKVDPGLCSATSCNDTGNHVHMDQKFLLVHTDVWKDQLMAPDTIFNEHNVWEFYDDLPELALNRAVLKPNSSNTTLQVYNIFKNEVDKIRGSKSLENAYIQILDRFDRRVDFVRHGITKPAVHSAFRTLFDNLNRNLDIQYRYDAMRDLIETYTEIKSLILHLNTDCNPVLEAFPKHVSLGPLNNPNHEPCRHRMYYSSLHKDKKDNLLTFKSLMIRFFRQLQSYSFVSNRPIKITSSRNFESPLGQRALPYYYNYSTTHKHWEQHLVRNRIPKQTHSYHRLGSNSNVLFPNQTSHLDKEFYRIEGHLGMTHDNALVEINKIRTDDGLAFDVKSVSVHANTKGIDWSKYKCHFTDLHSLLNSWQTDFRCLVKGFEQFFGNMPTDGSGIIGQQIETQSKLSLLSKSDDKEPKEVAAKGEAAKEAAGLNINSGAPQGLTINTTEKITIKKVVAEQMKTNELNCNLAGKALASYQSESLAHQEYQIAVMLPTQLYIHALMLNKVRSWSDFMIDATYLAEVQETIKAFCSDTNNFKQVMTNYMTSLQSKSGGMSTNQTATSSAQFAIFELINIYNRMKEVCCYTSKLNWLKSEIERRKKEILLELTLNNFTKKHSGAEHTAGVGKGETFVLVYAGEEEKSNPFGSTAQRVIADFTLPYLCATECAPSQIVVLPPAEKPDDTIDYKIENEGHDICEDSNFKLQIKPKPADNIIVEVESEISKKRIKIDPKEEFMFKDLVQWQGEKRSQGIRVFINDKEAYEALIHRNIDLEFEVVFRNGSFSFVNVSKEECKGKLMIHVTTKSDKGKAEPFDEKFQLGIEETSQVTIYCDTEICRPEWTVTLEPKKEDEKELIDLKFEVERLDNPIVEIVNGNKMPLTDKAYTMIVNGKKADINLSTSNKLLMPIEKTTVVKIIYDNGKIQGVWQETIEPRKDEVKIKIDLKFDVERMDNPLVEIVNRNKMPLTDKAYTLFVEGKKVALNLGSNNQLLLPIEKTTVVKITYDNGKEIGVWDETIQPAAQGKEKIDLKFTPKHVDRPLVELINDNAMPLSKGYSMFVNNKQIDIKLSGNNQLFLEVTKPTPVKIIFEDSKKVGVWDETIQPAAQGKETIEIGFDPMIPATGTTYQIANGTAIPFTNKGFSLSVGGKPQQIKLNSFGRIQLDIKEPTLVKITYEDEKQIGSWERTLGSPLVVIDKKSRTTVLANSKNNLSTIEESIKKIKPSTSTEKSMHTSTTKQLSAIKSAMTSPAKISEMAARLANPKSFKMLDGVAKSEQKTAMPYVETNMLAYFNLLSTMDDASFKKAVAPSAKEHQSYIKNHGKLFSAGFKKQLASIEFHADSADQYAKGMLAAMG